MSFISRGIAGSATRVAAPEFNGRRHRRYLRDNFVNFDRATLDSAGAFLIGELERLDPMIHEPLVSVTWANDIDLRTDVTMGDTTSSYTVSTFGAAGGAAPSGIAWASLEASARPRAVIDIGKKVTPLTPWSMDVAYTLWELESARNTGRPIDVQQLAGLNLKHQMDTDQMVYIGDASISAYGLCNSPFVTNTGNVANGAAGSATWVNKTADEILTDINDIMVSTWAASGYVAPPTKIGLSPATFGYISTTKVSNAGNETILSYVKTRNILTAQKGVQLDIVSIKWLATANRSGATSDRMIAYSQRPEYVRFPMVPLIPAVQQYDGIWVKVPYYGKLGAVEFVYPETLSYRDGIG